MDGNALRLFIEETERKRSSAFETAQFQNGRVSAFVEMLSMLREEDE